MRLVTTMPVALLIVCSFQYSIAFQLKERPRALGTCKSLAHASQVGRYAPSKRPSSLGGCFYSKVASSPKDFLPRATSDDESQDSADNASHEPRIGNDFEKRVGATSAGQSVANEPSIAKEKEKSPVQLFFDAVEMTFSYSFQFLGNLLFLGIFLNLCGYAYYFDSKKGLQIDTLANVRELIQFQDAAKKMQAPRQDVEVQPMSQLPK